MWAGVLFPCLVFVGLLVATVRPGDGAPTASKKTATTRRPTAGPSWTPPTTEAVERTFPWWLPIVVVLCLAAMVVLIMIPWRSFRKERRLAEAKKKREPPSVSESLEQTQPSSNVQLEVVTAELAPPNSSKSAKNDGKNAKSGSKGVERSSLSETQHSTQFSQAPTQHSFKPLSSGDKSNSFRSAS
jgi:hypothetical protein